MRSLGLAGHHEHEDQIHGFAIVCVEVDGVFQMQESANDRARTIESAMGQCNAFTEAGRTEPLTRHELIEQLA